MAEEWQKTESIKKGAFPHKTGRAPSLVFMWEGRKPQVSGGVWGNAPKRFLQTFSNAIRSAPLAMWMMPQRVKPFFKMTCCMIALSWWVSMRKCFVVCSQ